MSEPRFIVYIDNGDISVEFNDGPTELEIYDIAEVRAYSLDGERLLVESEGRGPAQWNVAYRPTGENGMSELEGTVRAYVDRRGLSVADGGDFLIDAANAIARADWQDRLPKRPRWLSRLVHGTAPMRFTRE